MESGHGIRRILDWDDNLGFYIVKLEGTWGFWSVADTLFIAWMCSNKVCDSERHGETKLQESRQLSRELALLVIDSCTKATKLHDMMHVLEQNNSMSATSGG